MKTILVVDDEPVIRSLAQLSLQDERWRVSLAVDASDALAAIERKKPDLIFLDLGLPGVSGRELAARLRADAMTAGIPIVYMTGRAPSECDGADAVISKPFTPEALRAQAGNWLSHA